MSTARELRQICETQRMPFSVNLCVFLVLLCIRTELPREVKDLQGKCSYIM